MMSIRERYYSDKAFQTLVNVFQAYIQECKFTPTEIREAAMLAQILYEEQQPARPIIFTRDQVMREEEV